MVFVITKLSVLIHKIKWMLTEYRFTMVGDIQVEKLSRLEMLHCVGRGLGKARLALVISHPPLALVFVTGRQVSCGKSS